MYSAVNCVAMGIMKRQHNISMFTTTLNKFKNW